MTAGRKLRWGILGVARINRRLLPAMGQSALCEVRAIASRSPERAREAAAAAEIPVAHNSYEALLADPTVDAVYVPLPNALHGVWVRAAAEAGKHVLCEKPLAATAAEAREVVALCRARGVVLMEGFMWPHHPRTARVRALLDDGAVGAVRRVSASFTFPLRPFDPSNVRLRPELAGGSLLDVGCYAVAAIRWAFGAEPVRVGATARYEYGVDVEMNGHLVLADGRVGAFDCDFTLPYRTGLEVVGTEGVLSIADPWRPDDDAAFTLRREGEPARVIRTEGYDQIALMVDHFCEAVLSGTAARPAPEEAVGTLAVLDALAVAARERREVSV